MKKINIILILALLVFSCKKQDITPGNYKAVPPQKNTTFVDPYKDGGVLPDWVDSDVKNELCGSSWILTKVIVGLVSTTYNDTLNFITNNSYTLGNDTAVKYRYSLYSVQNNLTLTFQPLKPVNSLQCTTDQLGNGFSKGPSGTIFFATFKDPYNVNNHFVAWFKKI